MFITIWYVSFLLASDAFVDFLTKTLKRYAKTDKFYNQASNYFLQNRYIILHIKNKKATLKLTVAILVYFRLLDILEAFLFFC